MNSILVMVNNLHSTTTGIACGAGWLVYLWLQSHYGGCHVPLVYYTNLNLYYMTTACTHLRLFTLTPCSKSSREIPGLKL